MWEQFWWHLLKWIVIKVTVKIDHIILVFIAKFGGMHTTSLHACAVHAKVILSLHNIVS